MQVDSHTAAISDNAAAIRRIMRGLRFIMSKKEEFIKVITDYITWEAMVDMDSSSSPEEEGSSDSEGNRMSVFPYNCKFRTVNLPDYDIAWLRIN